MEKKDFLNLISSNKTNDELQNIIELNQNEVWVIDDNAAIVSSCFLIWRLSLDDAYYQFSHFDTAKKAMEELKRRIKEKENLPGIILVDGYLDLDEGNFSNGPNVVKGIKEVCDKIKTIGFSSSEEKNEQMMANGAETAFSKIENIKTVDYLKQLAEKKEEQTL